MSPEVLDLAAPITSSSDDVHRSLRRYVSLMLGSPPWTVRLQRTRVADDERPVAIVEGNALTTPWSRAGMRSGDQGDVQKAQPYTVVCYPSIGETAASSSENARAIAVLLDAGFTRGLITDDDPPINVGAPWRLPVWNFADTPIEGPNRGGPPIGSPYMYASIDQFNVRPIQDSMDELRFTVVANLRASWWQGGRAAAPAPLATGGLTTPGYDPVAPA